jgi:hypothetical protein
VPVSNDETAAGPFPVQMVLGELLGQLGDAPNPRENIGHDVSRLLDH